MESKIILIYATCDEVLKALRIQDDPQAVMTNAEVMSFAIIAAKLFNSNHRLTRWLCIQSIQTFPAQRPCLSGFGGKITLKLD